MSIHKKGEHGYNGIWGGKHDTFHHNLMSHHTSWTPRFNNGNNPCKDEYLDFLNNVIYKWGFKSTYGGELCKHNVRLNYCKPGPATHPNVRNKIEKPIYALTISPCVQGKTKIFISSIP